MIIRSEKTKNYSVISNVILNDKRLSFAARGLAAFLLTKPDSWSINREYLASQGPEGVTAVRTMLKELRAAGYITQERGLTVSGRFQWVITLHEVVVENPPVQKVLVGNLPVDNAPVGKSTLVSTGVVSTGVVSTGVVKTEEVISLANGNGNDEKRERTAEEAQKRYEDARAKGEMSLETLVVDAVVARAKGKSLVEYLGARDASPLDSALGEVVRMVEDKSGLPITMMQREALEESLASDGRDRVVMALEQMFIYKKQFNPSYFKRVLADVKMPEPVKPKEPFVLPDFADEVGA